jgi:hypothetical protein
MTKGRRVLTSKSTKGTFDPVTRTGGPAMIVRHDAVLAGASDGVVQADEGYSVRKFEINRPGPRAQHPVSVRINYVLPGKRNWESCVATPDDYRYYKIKIGNDVVYDSRTEVPIDMAKFNATRQRFIKQWRDNGCTVITEEEVG